MPSGSSKLGYWFIPPTVPPEPPPGPVVNPTPVNKIADYIVAQYVFTDGRDLDTRSKMTVPNIGGDYVGWGRSGNQNNIVIWGGDNTGTGVESVLIDVNAYRSAYPATDTFTVDFNCFWYNTRGFQPVYLVMTMYQGGTMVKSGFTWTNTTATSSLQLTTTGKVITLKTTSSSSDGEPLGYMTYNVVTGIGSIDIY